MPQFLTKSVGESRRWGGVLSIGLIIGYLAGVGRGPSAVVRSDITEEPRREAFKAGAVLNEPILRDIAATLKRIESKVEKIEKNMTPAAPAKKK